MTKEGLEFIDNFIKDMENDENVVRVLKQNYAIGTNEEDFCEILKDANVRGFYCEYSLGRIISAYEPFMGIIKKIVLDEKIDIKEMFDSVGVYSLNRSLFERYIKGMEVKRDEKPLFPEHEYDKKMFINDMVGMLMYLSDIRPVLIILNEANQVCGSSLDIIERLSEESSFSLKVLVISNEMGSIKPYIAHRYKEFMINSDKKGIVSDWPFEGFCEEPREELTFSFRSTEEELDEIGMMVHTFAHEQANYYLGMIYQKVELDKIEVSAEYRSRMLILYIIVCISKENYSYAMVLCEKIHRIQSGDIEESRRDYVYYYYKCIANMYMGNDGDAVKNANLCNAVAVKMGKEYELFLAMMLVNMSQLAGWRDIWICDKKVSVPDELIELCYKYNYMNHLAHILVYCYDNDYRLYTVVEGIEDRTPSVTKGIEIARAIKNDKFLIEAYRKNVMVASCNGYFNVASYFYKKSIEITKRNNNRFEEANIYNGLGFNCCTADKFSEANKYYNKALRIFLDEKSSDYIMETLYNMGTNAILAEDYTHAYEYLITVVNILTTLKKNSLRVCNGSKLFGLIAVAAFKQGNYYTSQIYLNKSKNYLRYILEYCDSEDYPALWDDDLFLLFYVSALLAEKNRKLDDALEYFDKAEFYMRKSIGSKFFNFMCFAVDKSKLLRELGREKEARDLLKEARSYFNSKGNFLRVKMFDDLTNMGRWEHPPVKMSMTDTDTDEIMNFVKLESIQKEAELSKSNIRFFGTFQELINHRYHNVESMIDTLVTNFKNNFNLDYMLFVTCENGTPQIRYTDLEYDISQGEIEVILEHFRDNSTGFVISKFSNNYLDYDRILRIFDKSKVFSVVGVPIYKYEELYSFFITFVKIPDSWNFVISKEVLDEDDMEVYTIAFRQILDAIDKYRLNDMLIAQAITDELTGLYNRKGYYETVGKIINNAEKLGGTINCSFMYIDLDHFKYYNDTFGHHVGDAILKRFAEIFKESCGENGYVCRFGGDEFVILLKTSSESIIRKISDKIYSLIEKEDGFSSIVAEYSDRNKDTRIPVESRATCSIGADIGINISRVDQISVLQRRADAVLYYIKENGRGKLMMYDEMPVMKQADERIEK